LQAASFTATSRHGTALTLPPPFKFPAREQRARSRV